MPFGGIAVILFSFYFLFSYIYIDFRNIRSKKNDVLKKNELDFPNYSMLVYVGNNDITIWKNKNATFFQIYPKGNFIETLSQKSSVQAIFLEFYLENHSSIHYVNQLRIKKQNKVPLIILSPFNRTDFLNKMILKFEDCFVITDNITLKNLMQSLKFIEKCSLTKIGRPKKSNDTNHPDVLKLVEIITKKMTWGDAQKLDHVSVNSLKGISVKFKKNNLKEKLSNIFVLSQIPKLRKVNYTDKDIITIFRGICKKRGIKFIYHSDLGLYAIQ